VARNLPFVRSLQRQSRADNERPCSGTNLSRSHHSADFQSSTRIVRLSPPPRLFARFKRSSSAGACLGQDRMSAYVGKLARRMPRVRGHFATLFVARSKFRNLSRAGRGSPFRYCTAAWTIRWPKNSGRGAWTGRNRRLRGDFLSFGMFNEEEEKEETMYKSIMVPVDLEHAD